MKGRISGVDWGGGFLMADRYERGAVINGAWKKLND